MTCTKRRVKKLILLLRSGCHENAFFTEPVPAHLTVLTGVFKGNYDSL